MPGGEQAIREPWRMAVAYLVDANLNDSLLAQRLRAPALATVRRMIDRRTNCPATSSVGRLFDGVAALVGLRDRVSYEGQAAMELEWLAEERSAADVSPLEFDLVDSTANDSPILIDTRPLFTDVAGQLRRGCEARKIARRFHSTMVEIVAKVCGRIRQRSGLDVVALSGGVFQNALLTTEVIVRLERAGFLVHRHRRVPPGDGGLSLGQLAVAAANKRIAAVNTSGRSSVGVPPSGGIFNSGTA